MKTEFRSRLLVSTLLISVAAIATPAFAQTTSTEAQGPAEDTAEGDIVVTGTLIKNPNLVSSSPVTVVGESEIQLRNSQTAEQILRDLPGSAPGTGSAVNNGQGGFATVNLRNLGSQRNLVLLDGSRLVPANQNGTVDLNNIPVALIERVDVLTGGASTTYGADAVSGVVNFITKSDFAGMDASASQRITEDGDANYFRADLSIGANFDDGRGNAVLSVGYQEADPLYQGARDISVFTIGSPNGVASGASPTSVPTTITINGARNQLNAAGTLLGPEYAGFNFAPFNIFVTPFKRYNIYAAGHYELSDTVEVYSRGMFSKNTVSSIIAPSGIFGEALTIPGANPYLPAGVRDQLCASAGIALGATCNTNAAIPLAAVFRRTVEVGPRISDYTTTMFDYKAGIKVNLTSSIALDVSGAYGENDIVQVQSGYVLRSRVQQALNATNTASCTVTTNNCVPLNLFGAAGSITDAQAAFLNGSSTITTKTQLSQARAVLSGDFGFVSPYASEPVGFAVGGEYRSYGYQRLPDNFAISPGELGGAGGAVLPFAGGYNVKEAYGELLAPLVSDKAFFQSLTLEAGVRYSDYKIDGANGFDTTTYKGGLSWEPVSSLKLRGNYQRAVRAPNISELFSPVVTALDNLSTEPCVGAAPVGNVNLTLACRNQGAPAASIGIIPNPASGQVNVTGGGNANIQPEVANTYTLGAVFQPRNIVPGLTITADYYNIKIKRAITSAVAGDIISACFGANPAAITAAQAASAACTSIRRSAADGSLSGSPATVFGLPQPLTNLGRLETDGIDVNFNYARKVGAFGLNLNFAGNWTNKSTFQASSSSVNRDCVGYYSVNCASIQPKFSWNQRTTLTYEKIDLSLLWRHLGRVTYEGQADDFVARGYTAGNRSLFNGVVTGPTPLAGGTYNFNRIKATNYFDLAVRFQADDHFDLTFSMQNLLDKQPPLVGSTAGSTAFNSGNTYPSSYDVLGRTFNASARLHF